MLRKSWWPILQCCGITQALIQYLIHGYLNRSPYSYVDLHHMNIYIQQVQCKYLQCLNAITYTLKCGIINSMTMSLAGSEILMYTIIWQWLCTTTLLPMPSSQQHSGWTHSDDVTHSFTIICPLSLFAEELSCLQIMSSTSPACSPGTRWSSVNIPYSNPSLSTSQWYKHTL